MAFSGRRSGVPLCWVDATATRYQGEKVGRGGRGAQDGSRSRHGESPWAAFALGIESSGRREGDSEET